MKVLIGVDGSSNSFAAVEFVGRLLSAERDELVLLFATPEMNFEDERLDPAIEQRARSALSRTVLEAALERLPAPWPQRAEQRQVTGSASAVLLDAIEAEKADRQLDRINRIDGIALHPVNPVDPVKKQIDGNHPQPNPLCSHWHDHHWRRQSHRCPKYDGYPNP